MTEKLIKQNKQNKQTNITNSKHYYNYSIALFSFSVLMFRRCPICV